LNEESIADEKWGAKWERQKGDLVVGRERRSAPNRARRKQCDVEEDSPPLNVSSESVSSTSAQISQAETDLRLALHILSIGTHYIGEEWLLLATLIGEADLTIRQARMSDPSLQMPLLEAATRELRKATSGFTDPDFLRATRAARRRNPGCFDTTAVC
jgi:hypothetical protein